MARAESISLKWFDFLPDELMEDGTAPPLCYEPCSYNNYKYELSSSAFPTAEYWDESLSAQVEKFKAII